MIASMQPISRRNSGGSLHDQFNYNSNSNSSCISNPYGSVVAGGGLGNCNANSDDGGDAFGGGSCYGETMINSGNTNDNTSSNSNRNQTARRSSNDSGDHHNPLSAWRSQPPPSVDSGGTIIRNQVAHSTNTHNFGGGGGGGGNDLGLIPIQPGEIVDGMIEFERPLSAPPPPGFNAGHDERNRLANELLWGGGGGVQNTSISNDGNRDHGNNSNNNSNFGSNQTGMPTSPPHHQNLHHRDFHGNGGGGVGSQGDIQHDERTSSFTNLAAVLGSGLVQSMEDATQDTNRLFGGGPGNTSSDNNDALSSYHRMTRHAANRLVGASPLMKQNHLNYDLHLPQQLSNSNNINPNNKHGVSVSGLIAENNNQQEQGQHQRMHHQNHHHGKPTSELFDHGEVGQGHHHQDLATGSLSVSGKLQQLDHHHQQQVRRSPLDDNGGGMQQQRGFPSSLSTPERNNPNGNNGNSNGNGNGNSNVTGGDAVYGAAVGNQRRALPSKDIGMNVMEPEDDSIDQFKSGIVSHRVDNLGQFQRPVAMNNIDNRSNQYGSNNSYQQQSNKSNNEVMTMMSIGNNLSMSALERGVQNLWHPDAREFHPSSMAPTLSNATHGASAQSVPPPMSGISSLTVSGNAAMTPGSNADLNPMMIEMELQPYLWEADQQKKKPSRTIAILRCSYLRVPDVRSAAETYGVLESFRADFSSKGIFFASYYDIRSAQYAAVELQSVLQRLSVMQRSSDEVLVRYCISLTASSQFDEGQILISDLPHNVSDYELKSLLSSYGSLRSIVDQGEGSYIVEFHNVQDSKQALLELDSTQPWGPNIAVEVGLRNPIERKKGRDLLAMIGRWRMALNRQPPHNTSNSSDKNMQYPGASIQRGSGVGGMQGDGWHSAGGGNGGNGVGVDATGRTMLHNNNNDYAPSHTQTQFILGPDGRYTPIVMSQAPGGAGSSFPSQFSNATTFDPRHQQVIQGPNGQIFIASIPTQVGPGGQVFLQQHYGGNYTPQIVSPGHHFSGGGGGSDAGSRGSRVAQNSTPYYTHVVSSSTENASLSGRSHRSAQSSAGGGGGAEEKDTRHLLLDVDNVEIGHDTRTSLMVRNIPNKYTQQMLLNEFEENGHGPGVIDFFYLPIDFKNRCNRGYAFINFVDYKDIVQFHRRYFGKHWRTFNSDKICDITYARIQGKQAMLKRFENSALMEKDDEYKPLVFVSDGPEKGRRLPFPDPNSLIHANNHNNATRAVI